MSGHDLMELSRRIPAETLQKRLAKEQRHTALQFEGGFRIYWENLDWLAPILELGLRCTGLLWRGLNNARQFTLQHNNVVIPGLPAAFNGFRVLHLSDLHIEGMVDHGEALHDFLKPLQYDMCVITGDFRFLTFGPFYDTVAFTQRICQALDREKPLLGILGNHDFLELLPPLEQIGIQMLINESCVIRRGAAEIGFAGVDDPHFYQTADLPRAMDGIRHCPVKILLAHSQELIPEAAAAGVDLYLCGHTHGGQICLPGGHAVITNTKLGRRFISGAWQEHAMQGYTSRGIGSSGLAVRYQCPPEVIIHHLHSTPAARTPA